MTSTAAARDGTPLLVRSWPPSGALWLHVLIVHGLEDHSGRYERVGDQYASNGVAAHGFDQRWAGGSGGPRGDIDRWDVLLDDLEDRLSATRAGSDGLPIALHAHSLGGLIGTDYLMSGRPRPDLAVLTAPGLDDRLARWKHAFAPLAARVLPTFRLPNEVDPESLARDRSDASLYGDDPLRIPTTSTRMAAMGFSAQKRVTAAVTGADRMPVPTLILHGSADTLVPPRATEPFARLANARRVVYPDLRHELHNEPEGPAVVADIVAWLRGHLRDGHPRGGHLRGGV
jgi:alpha-beta hydrolase superfamily lysophospholipase